MLIFVNGLNCNKESYSYFLNLRLSFLRTCFHCECRCLILGGSVIGCFIRGHYSKSLKTMKNMEDSAPKFSSSGYIPITNNNVVIDSKDVSNASYIQSSKRPRRSEDGRAVSPEKCVVWKTRSVYSPGVVGLHEEIEDYCGFVSPTEKETNIRLQVIEHITKTITSLWPQAKVETFGSFRTGLFLPSSDIDVVVIGNWVVLPLNTLSKALEESGIRASDIVILSRATVPIIKLTHSPTKVRVDISFNMKNGISSAKMIKECKNRFPSLSKLVLVLKQFLKMRNLNEVFNGGMSSYCLTLLVINFLQGPHRPRDLLPAANLGTLLIEFFELFGLNFNYDKVAISVKGDGSYKPKSVQWSYLSVEDPLDADNDIAKGSYSMPSIKFAFESAYHTLHRAVNDSCGFRAKSILDLIVHFDDEVLQHRRWVFESFDTIIKSFCHSPSEDQSRGEECNSSESGIQPSFNSSGPTQSLRLAYSSVANSDQTFIPSIMHNSEAGKCNVSMETQRTIHQPFQKVNSKPVQSNGPNKLSETLCYTSHASSNYVNQGNSLQVAREFHNQRYNQGNSQTVQSSRDYNFDMQEKKRATNKRSKQTKRNLQQISANHQR